MDALADFFRALDQTHPHLGLIRPTRGIRLTANADLDRCDGRQLDKRKGLNKDCRVRWCSEMSG